MRVKGFRSELERLGLVLLRLGCFDKEVDVNLYDSASRMAKRIGIDVVQFYFRSLRQSRGRVYLVCRTRREEILVCFEHPSISEGKTSSVFSDVTRDRLETSGAGLTAYVTSFTSENLRRLTEEEFPDLSPRNLGRAPRLGLGVRMLFTLPPLLRGIEKVRCLVDFQLSAGREFSLKEVVEAVPGQYPEWLGHTGLDAATLYGTIAKECFKYGRAVYGTESDHAIVSPEPSAAITRIRNSSQSALRHVRVDDASMEESFRYNRRIIEEATGTGFVVGITTDTSALLREEVDDLTAWPEERLHAEYEAVVPVEERKTLEQYYHPGVPHLILDTASDSTFELTFTKEELTRLAVKFTDSLLANKRLHEYMVAGMKGRSFTFEISLDEAYKNLTTEKELFFYLAQSDRMGMRADLVAPNVGLRKRQDYEGDLKQFEQRVRKLAAIASHYGAILDFHSGSDKRVEVYRAISRATSGYLKLKMSGVFQLLYFETLSSFGLGTEERRLFERIWRYTLHYAKRKADEGDEAAGHMLRKLRYRTAGARRGRRTFKVGPRDEFFRHYSFITVGAKNKLGNYLFRNALYKLAEKPNVAERYDRRVVGLTVKVAKALGLERSNHLTSGTGPQT
jgi:hypothetical protein